MVNKVQLIDSLDGYLRKKTSRSNIQIENHIRIYRSSDKINAWLLNPIEIVDQGKIVTIKIPSGYKRKIVAFLQTNGILIEKITIE